MASGPGVVRFSVGQIFGDREVLKDLIRKHAIESRRELYFLRNDSKRIRVVCNGNVPQFNDVAVGPGQKDGGVIGHRKGKSGPSQKATEVGGSSGQKGKRKYYKKMHLGDCPWVLYALKIDDGNTWMVRTYKPEHTCLQSRKIKACTAGFMAKESWVVSQVGSNPQISIKSLQDQLQISFEVGVSRQKDFRTKMIASNQLKGDYKEQYNRLRDYILEVCNANPNTTVKFQVSEEANTDSTTRVFNRVYICLGALKEGFNACQRQLLGLDGAFMKGPYPGQLLTAVGLDPNNGFYPLAYAIVEAENKNSWIWFLQCVQDDLGLASNSNFTFISDRQKVGTIFVLHATVYCFLTICCNLLYHRALYLQLLNYSLLLNIDFA
jgi:hypothetical protein